MKKQSVFSMATTLLGVALLCPAAEPAEKGQPAVPRLEEGKEAIVPPEIAAGAGEWIADPAFDRYVDLHLLSQGVRELDPILLTDSGLQLAEGERVLQRTHKTGITAKEVLRKAATLAANKQDKGTLDRLERAAEKIKDTELSSHLRNASKLMEASRTVDPASLVSINEMKPETFAVLKELYNQVAAAELVSDADHLKSIQQQLKQAEDLPAASKTHLQRKIDKVIEDLPKTQNPASAALTKLVGASRGGFGFSLPKPIANTPFDPATWHLPPQDHTQFVGYSKVKITTRIYLDSRVKTVIHYYVDGKRIDLSPRHYETHTRTYSVGGNSGPARMTIRFHNGQYYGDGREVYQTYALDGGNYEFAYSRGKLDLFRHR